MKKIGSILLIFLLLLCAHATAETEITVPGSATDYVSADTATISLGVSANKNDVKTAQATVNTALAAIRESLIEFGISKDAIFTDTISLYSMWDGNGAETVTTYYASSYLTIQTTDLESVGKIIDLAFDAGANSLDGVTFNASDASEAEEIVLRNAIKDAQAQASIIADAAGLKINGIKSIQKETTYNYDSRKYNSTIEAASADGSEETTVQPSKISVNASVTVVFLAE